MKRTKLKERILPNYTKGEELFNSISHIVGGAFAIFALVSCVITAALHRNVWGIVGSAIYGTSLIVLYTMSSVYHGLHKSTAKKVMQILDHCAIFFLIAGTYTPIVLGPIREHSAVIGWTIFGFVWVCAIIGIIFNSIDLKKYSKLSMTAYIGMGWCIVAAAKTIIEAIEPLGLLFLLLGGISYTVGAILYNAGIKKSYMHCVFHIFVVIGSILQYITICFYVI